MGSCRKCSMKCLLTHGKKDGPGPIVSSFSKVMVHDRYLDYMYIPPKFSPEIASLADTEQRVEDTSGRHWTVSVSFIDGYLSFGRGWHSFASDHGIKLGDFVIVHYVLGSHFVVQIYGRSGCEKLFPSAPNSDQNPRAKPSKSSVDNGSSTSDSRVDVNVTQEAGSSKAQPMDLDHTKGVKRKFVEDPCCMIIDRDISTTPRADTRTFFDLSEFESCKTIPVCGNGSLPTQDGEREEQVPESSFFEENMIDYAAFEAAMKIPCDKILPEIRPSMSAESKMKHVGVPPRLSPEVQTTTLRDQGVVKKCKGFNPKGVVGASVGIAEKQHKDFNPEGFGGSVKTVQKELKVFSPKSIIGGSVKLVKKEPKGFNLKSSGNEISQNKSGYFASHPGGSVRTVKKEIMENSNPQNFGKKGNAENQASVSGGNLKKVKAEVEDFSEARPPSLVICPVTSDVPFLELAKNFSLSRCRSTMEVEEKVLHLEDVVGRQWTVFYHKKMGMKVLTGGWKQFREANKIRTGDKCVFILLDESKSLYKVRVISKP